ncbi:MAG: exodeoxyribonuclease VII large subunit [Desulfuromonas sp.]|nr:MAG: exodeoxyribonuclease VII large subunit [Desulfuromonas sp.]
MFDGECLTVSVLVGLLQEVVESNFMQVVVEGEISNFSAPASGHLYLTLKDEGAQVRVAMFRPQARLLRFQPENGMSVVCRGRASIYRQRGELQLIVDRMEPRGIGSMQVAFEQLKERLKQEGLFDPDRKRPLPAYPRNIGIVTSATGAAIRDILNVLSRRATGLRILLRPVAVQGEAAAGEIATAIEEMNRHGEVDVLLVGRGGGSLEDLWAFNEEVVARAIACSAIPVVSAVGHETDTTIADFVADLRAPTPSAGAELVVRNRQELEGHLDHLSQRLARQMDSRLRLLSERVTSLQRRLIPPRQRLDMAAHRHAELKRRLLQAWHHGLADNRKRAANLSAHLDALSPLGVLQRGYALVYREDDGCLVRESAQTNPGDQLTLRLGRGVIKARVTEVDP